MVSKMNSVEKIARGSLLALLVMSFAMAAGPVRAQEQPAAPPKQRQSNDSGKQPGFGQQLARETREAAGEEQRRCREGRIYAVALGPGHREKTWDQRRDCFAAFLLVSISPSSRESLSGQLANICRAHSVRAPRLFRKRCRKRRRPARKRGENWPRLNRA